MVVPTNIPAPSFKWLIAEPRAVLESLSVVFKANILKNVPRGNGEPVMVLPGLGTTDRSTKLLRLFLNKIGYVTYGWELGINRGFKPEYEATIIKKLRQLYLKHEQPVKLIGWSMGGIFAREIAKIDPRIVSQVITMGSPFSGGKSQKTHAARIYKLLNGQRIDATHDRRALHMPEAPPVPTTALYSKTDGIVCWQYCKEYDEGESVESIEVRGSHIGLGANSMVWYILADRLAQTPENWKPFDKSKLQEAEQWLLV